MKRFLAMLVLPAFLLACGSGSNPFAPDPAPVEPTDPDPDPDATPVTPAGIPTTLAGDLGSFTFDPVNETLTVSGLNLDELPLAATYRRRPALDQNGYLAFTAQDDPLDRHVTAFVRQSNNDEAVRAGVTVTGGPRNRFFGGGFYERDGNYTPPAVTATTGLVTYSGDYVGLTNLTGDSGDLLALPGGIPTELIPNQVAEVTGDIVLQADFADNTVEGNIINRVLTDSGTNLPSVVLIVSSIDANGEFFGNVEYEQSAFADPVIGTDIGDYGGIFGGQDASGVAGIVKLNEFDGPNNPLGMEFEEEYGVFVLDQCGQPVDDALCVNVN